MAQAPLTEIIPVAEPVRPTLANLDDNVRPVLTRLRFLPIEARDEDVIAHLVPLRRPDLETSHALAKVAAPCSLVGQAIRLRPLLGLGCRPGPEVDAGWFGLLYDEVWLRPLLTENEGDRRVARGGVDVPNSMLLYIDVPN